ncbi:ATP-dependent sacrificial sulfur transferase LarE [Acetohalobium arabaticum]|uniref:PP-loop domain protein n=1 Tax=Acetohalobium arabaticum (strain ATCC 49924 / DSM 5501 / Z-7288) TaxID=574087 RepID=D9QTQ0_ACEAZ|nr:ATP-dependent sacrificial sulfur transferase LarE [Acetohalobium arabaticum]ADL11814.1 PP-loop domain protein [Acetohalobium arabaticum DSM 5501]
MTSLEQKFTELKDILRSMDSLLVAFSGGVDSTLLLKVAHDILGDQAAALTVEASIHPPGEAEEAEELAQQMGVEHILVEADPLQNEDFARNDKLRCYYCKYNIFSDLKEIAAKEGYAELADGANYDDFTGDYRPGLKAAEELGVRSPLKEAEITKEEVRKLSKRLDLPTWDKPSLSCYATRFPYGSKITKQNLDLVAAAEEYLHQFGLKQLRVRHHDQATARIEVLPDDIEKLIEKRQEIVAKLKELGYTYVTLDLEGYRTGSLNEILDEEE